MAKAKTNNDTPASPLLPKIHTIRRQRVVLDADLAALYEVQTFRLNEAVKRNEGRFPDDFRFKLTREEVANLISQNAISSRGHGGLRTLPWAFTEHGCLMAATVLRSEKAVQMSLYLVRAFVQMREQISANLGVLRRLAEIDKKAPRARRRAPRGGRTPQPAPQSPARGRDQETQDRLPPRQPLVTPTVQLSHPAFYSRPFASIRG